VDGDREYVTTTMAEAHRWGLQIARASDPAIARDSLARICPDALLLDCSERSRQAENLQLLQTLADQCPGVPVFVLADGAESLDREAIARLGGRGFYRKSIPAERLLEKIQQALIQAPAGSFAEPTPQGSHILIVDDDRLMLALLKGILEPWGLRVTLCSDPLQCEALVAQEMPDLLVLDLEMPQMNGIDLCQRLRNDARTAVLPILVLTAHQDADTIQKVFSVGADDYVSKPVIAPELMTRIFNRLERSYLVQRQSEQDEVTQLFNRLGSMAHFGQRVALAAQWHQPLGLGILSLESLIQINRTLGYEVGDALLCTIADSLRTGLAEILGSDGSIARWENGEFVVVMPGMTTREVRQFLEQVSDRVYSQIQAQIQERSPAGSLADYGALGVGAAELAEGQSTIATLYQAAGRTLIDRL